MKSQTRADFHLTKPLLHTSDAKIPDVCNKTQYFLMQGLEQKIHKLHHSTFLPLQKASRHNHT